MLYKKYLYITFFLILCFLVNLSGEELVDTYFPDSVGSSWVYVDQDGNEFTRLSVEEAEMPKQVYHRFFYEQNINDSDYKHQLHPTRFQISDDRITFFASDKIEKVIKARLTKEMETLFGNELSGDSKDSYDIKVDVEKQFHALLIPVTSNEEWDAVKINALISIEPDHIEGIGKLTYNVNIYETGRILATETIETPAGIFEDCLKIEYQTETELSYTLYNFNEGQPGETRTTLWMAPNVGIVKFHQVMEDILLPAFPDENFPIIQVVTTYELKDYKITPNTSSIQNNYFPNTPNSYWIYVDQNGKELTRRTAEDDVIPAQKLSAFKYVPKIDIWEDYLVHMQPHLYKVDKTGIKFYYTDEIEKVVKAGLTEQVEFTKEFNKVIFKNIPAMDVTYEILTDSPNYLNFLPNPIPLNEEWVVSKTVNKLNARISNVMTIKKNYQTDVFSIVESGKVVGKETVITPAGKFVDCLKIEFSTKTSMSGNTLDMLANKPASPGESITTVWLAPNVGIVKFNQQSEKVLLKAIADYYKTLAELSKSNKIKSNIDFDNIDFKDFKEHYAKTIKTVLLKNYEITAN